MKNLLNGCMSLIRKIVPEGKPHSAVGLDIGTTSCKAVELNKEGNVYKITNWAVAPVFNNDLKSAVKKLWASWPEPPSLPVNAVSGKGTLIRYIEMPRMSVADMKKSFAIEADKYFPFPPDQIYTDCFALGEAADNRMTVLVAASKKEIIDERIKFFNDLGLQADVITLNAIAIANVAQVLGFGKIESGGEAASGPAPKKSAVAVLDMGEAVSSLSIIADGLPRFNRDIYAGGRDLTKALANSLATNFAEAEKIKCRTAERVNEVLGAVESVILQLVTEVRLSFDYFVTERNLPIGNLFLTGGAAQLAGIEEVFAKGLDVRVSPWDPFAAVEIDGRLRREDLRQHVAELTVALGLALLS